MTHVKHSGLALGLLFLLAAEDVSATTVLPAQYDARSVGMGGTGVAWAHNGTAVFHNPAGLAAIDRFTFTAVFSPFFPIISAPVAGPGTEAESTRTPIPILFLGGGYRLSERLVLGLGAFAASGVGASYENVPAAGGNDLSGRVAALELSIPLAFAATEELSIAIAPRIAYAARKLDVLAPDPMSMQPVRLEQDLSGFDFLGVTAGLHYRPNETIEVGFVYQSKMTVDVDGSVTVGEMKFDASSTDPSSPHALKAGVAYSVIPDRFQVALDFGYFFFGESHDRVVTTMESGGVETETVTRLRWKDSVFGHVGAEYFVHPIIPVRLGYAVGNSATPKETANPFLLSPGLLHSLHAGVGLRQRTYDIDLGFTYLFIDETVESGVNAGRYRSSGPLLSLSATYRK